MSRRSPDDVGVSEPAAEEDVVEIGHRQPWPLGEQWFQRRPWLQQRPRPVVLLAAACLVIGLVVGFVAGNQHGRSTAASAPHSPTATITTGPILDNLALSQTGNECSAQTDGQLQLGVQVMNVSARGVVLQGVRPLLPLGGLKVMSQAWGPCGELPAVVELPDDAMPAGASTWFTVTFQVLVKCPAALPVQFAVDYTLDGRPSTAKLSGFPDLGRIPWRNCPVG
jgi:hypothetical protein